MPFELLRTSPFQSIWLVSSTITFSLSQKKQFTMAEAPKQMQFLKRRMPSRIDHLRRVVGSPNRVTFCNPLVTSVIEIPSVSHRPALKQRLFYSAGDINDFRYERDRIKEAELRRSQHHQEHDNGPLSLIRSILPPQQPTPQHAQETTAPRMPLHSHDMGARAAPPPASNTNSQRPRFSLPSYLSREKTLTPMPLILTKDPFVAEPPQSTLPQFRSIRDREADNAPRSTRGGLILSWPERKGSNARSKSNSTSRENLSAFSWYMDQMQQPAASLLWTMSSPRDELMYVMLRNRKSRIIKILRC